LREQVLVGETYAWSRSATGPYLDLKERLLGEEPLTRGVTAADGDTL
jgi:hypothetical protein